MLYIELNSGKYLYENAIVRLGDSPDNQILKYGWYELDGTTSSGWYFMKIADRSITPVTSEILSDISILDRGDWINSVAPQELPCAADIPAISVYRTNTMYVPGQIVYAEFGKLYQVCTTYISETIEADVENMNLSPIPASADTPYTNPSVPSVSTIGDALDYIISKLSESGD